MSVREHKIQAILSVTDNNFTNGMNKAKEALKGLDKSVKDSASGTKSFKDSMLGMASAIGVTSLVSKGFDMIRASVDRAFNRIDTMDNFNRTVALLTGNSKLAELALNDLKDSVTGTAYGLDTAAKSTQGLIAAGIKVGDSTRYIGGWMDAVSTYGDGTNETLGNVTFQLSQMAAKGKANLGDLKSAMEAGIPVVKIYAEAMGISAEEASKAISEGTVSAESFMEAMDNAFRNGTASFAKIEGAAKTAGGTWKGTFDNMQAAVTRGMQSIITSIEEGRRSVNLPTMKDGIKSFGQVVESSLKTVGTVAGFAAKHFETLSTVVLTGAKAWAGYKIGLEVTDKLELFRKKKSEINKEMMIYSSAISKATSLNSIYNSMMMTTAGSEKIAAAAKKLNIELTEMGVRGKLVNKSITEAQKLAILEETGALTLNSIAHAVLTGNISLATGAQLAFNAAFKANPIGFLVTGVMLGVTALKGLYNWLTKVTPEEQKQIDLAKQRADAEKELSDSIGKTIREHQFQNAEANIGQERARGLVARYKELQAQAGMSAEKMAELKMITSQLNSIFPDLDLKLDETTGSFDKTTSAIEAQIDSMDKLAKQKASMDYLNDYTRNKNKQKFH